MLKSMMFGTAAAAALFAAPASAEIFDVPLGVIVVPPTQTFTPGQTFVAGNTTGPTGANVQFTISQAMTLTVSSFTNSSIGGTGIFDFTSIGLFSGFITSLDTLGTPLQTGTISTDGNTKRASLNQFSLDQGSYTIAYRGTVTGPPAGVGGNITFAAGQATPGVPEPATWGMMILGFGTIGLALRRRGKVRTSVSYA